MSVVICVTIAVLGQLGEPMQSQEDFATLIVVASGGGDPGAHQFLTIRAARDELKWSLIEVKGSTSKGEDPEGTVLFKGAIRGSVKQLRNAFQSTLGEITDRKSNQPILQKGQRVPHTFSVILVELSGVRTCKLMSGAQQRALVDGEDLKALFTAVRKEVFGIGYMMSDLLQIGRNPYLREPRIQFQEDFDFGPSRK